MVHSQVGAFVKMNRKKITLNQNHKRNKMYRSLSKRIEKYSLSLYLSVSVILTLSLYLSLSLHLCLYIRLYVCMFIYVPVCLSVCFAKPLSRKSDSASRKIVISSFSIHNGKPYKFNTIRQNPLDNSSKKILLLYSNGSHLH